MICLKVGNIIKRKRVIAQNEYETEIGVVYEVDNIWHGRAFVRYTERNITETIDRWIHAEKDGKFPFTKPEEHWLLTMPNNEESM